MRAVSILRLRWRSLFARQRVERELDEELRYHLERQIDEAIAAGLPPDEARRAAFRSMADLEVRKEECRDMRGTRWLDEFASDLRYAFRQLSKQKSFFTIAALTLALGIGANTAIFSAVNAVLLRPLPYPHSERLASVWCAVPSKGVPRMGCALPDLDAIAARNHSFDAFARYYFADINIADGTPERTTALYASATLFPLLGARPALGRTFERSEEVFGSHRVVVLSDSLWRERFAGSAGAISSVIHLDGQPYTVIGVMPPDFQFPNPSVRLWLPMSFAPKDDMATRDNHFIWAIARRRGGVTILKSGADVQSIAGRLEREFPQNAGIGAGASDYLASVTGDVRPALLILLGAVAVVLLIACVNVANLLLARASGRQRELSIRTALGAGRGRVLRQLLTEGALLGVAGACLGLALSAWLVRLIQRFGPEDIPRMQNIGMDAKVLAFTGAATLASILLFAVAPAMNLARLQVSEALKEGGRSVTGSLRTSRSRDALVVVEVALSLVLVAGAGLLLATLRRLHAVDPGLQPSNVLTMSVTLPQNKYPDSEPVKAAHFFDELARRLARLPGVKSAAASTALPITGWGGWGRFFTVASHPAPTLAEVPLIQYRQVTPDFAKALGIRIVEGRFFSPDDSGGAPLVAVINQAARRRFFPNEDPIGQRVYANPPEATVQKDLPSPGYRFPRLTIIGVIADVRQSGLGQPPEPELFVPHLQGTAKDNQTPANKMFLFIKTTADPLSLVNAARRVVRSLDPEQPVADVASMEDRLQASLSLQRFQLDLFGAFAFVALVLAAVGVYGVLSYTVRLRMHEIGVRMALGATASDVLRIVARHGLSLGIAGVLIGAALGLGLTRLMASLLFGVRPDDPATFLAAAFVLLAVVAAASVVPSVRAARTDALAVLRNE